MNNKDILRDRYEAIQASIDDVKNEYSIKDNIKILAVTKYVPIEIVEDFISLNTNSPLAESKAQSLRDRASIIDNVEWHFIGRIQSNKIKYIVDYASLIHSVDNIDIASEISSIAKKKNKIIDILLEVNISGEHQKGGCSLKKFRDFYDSVSCFDNIRVRGVMGMASYTDDTQQVEKEFESLREVFEKIKSEDVNILSSGMSGDYKLAIKHGSNMVRIGSLLFESLTDNTSR